MSANSVAALAYRAREGLRQAFLTMHVQELDSDLCSWTHRNLGAYIRDGISRRDAAKVEEHLDECRRCMAIYLELTEVNSNLAGILAPVLLGGAAAAYVGRRLAGGRSALKGGVLFLVDRARDLVAAHAPATAVAGVRGDRRRRRRGVRDRATTPRRPARRPRLARRSNRADTADAELPRAGAACGAAAGDADGQAAGRRSSRRAPSRLRSPYPRSPPTPAAEDPEPEPTRPIADLADLAELGASGRRSRPSRAPRRTCGSRRSRPRRRPGRSRSSWWSPVRPSEERPR